MRERIQAAGSSAAFTALAIVTALAVSGAGDRLQQPRHAQGVGRLHLRPGRAPSRRRGTSSTTSFFALFDTSLERGRRRSAARCWRRRRCCSRGLSVALAFRAGLFNIGGAGQLMMGATAAAFVGFKVDFPAVIHLPARPRCRRRRRHGLGRHRRGPQGAHRRPRGDQHDHAQLHRPRAARLPPGSRDASAAAAATT